MFTRALWCGLFPLPFFIFIINNKTIIVAFKVSFCEKITLVEGTVTKKYLKAEES